MRIPGMFILASIPFVAGALFVDDKVVSLFCFGVSNFLYSTYLGPSINVAHMLVPASLRALTSAILFLVLNLVGLGFGPLVVGMISDVLSPSLGVAALRWAMSGVMIVSFISVMLFFAGSRKLSAISQN